MTSRLALSTLLSALLCVPVNAADTSLAGLKSRILGQWISIACEVRPQQNADNPQLAPSPTYLKRNFTYVAEDVFSATITVYADPACTVPAASYDFAGTLVWHGRNPAVEGAWSQDYVLNTKLELTVLAPPMAAQLNQLPEGACGEGPFQTGERRDILGKPCVLLKFPENSKFVVDHDFLYVPASSPDLLFMGAKHVDGTGFYFPENRPQVGLQQPLIRIQP